jgi:type III secretion protein SpaR/YscT/HrcT
MVQVPFLGAKNLPMLVRMMFAVALVAIFLPQNLLSVTREIPYGMPWIGLMCKELLIGVSIGFLAAGPFFIAQMAGTLIEHSRGASSLQISDPTTQSQTGPIGMVFNYTLIAIFFALGGPFIFFDGLAESYQIVPVDKMFNAAFFNMDQPYWKLAFDFGNHAMTLCVQLAAPALIGILLTDMFLGIANRLAPQVQIVFLGVSLKSWVGIALLTASWALVIKVMGNEAITWSKTLNHLIQGAGYYISK